MREKVNFIVLGVILVIISYFSLNSGGIRAPSGASFVPLHGIAYFVLAAAFLVNFHDTDKGHLEAVLSAFVFGVLMEFLQLYVPERMFSFKDMGVNLAGASIVMLDHRIRIVSEFVRVEDEVVEWLLAKTGL